MPLANLISGQPFKAAFRALVVFALVYCAAGTLLVRAVDNSLQAELVAQTEAELVLLAEIFGHEGQNGLIDAMHSMDRALRPPERLAGLLDAQGVSLTGPLKVIPDFVGTKQRQITGITADAYQGTYLLNVQKIKTLTLVVGRNTAAVTRATSRLILGLVSFGVLIALSILGLGLWASRTSYQRLEGMESALRQVATGDMSVRLPVLSRNDQFDRVSVRMNQNLDQLSRLMTSVKSTASAIAHDLKTPLSHAQIALLEAADSAEAGEDPLPRIDAALAEIEGLNSVFETMLRISRIQASNDRSRFAPVDLSKVAYDVQEFMQPFVDKHGQKLDVKLAEVVINADGAMIKQALVNLVKNASVHAGQGACILISAETVDGAAQLSVTDNGPGIPKDQRQKVLEPFARLDTARSTPGSGLGLALIRAVADHHDAILTLSDAAPGLRVSIDFPNLKDF